MRVKRKWLTGLKNPVLDVGCGVSETPCTVGIDPSSDMLSEAKGKQLVLAVGEALPFRDGVFHNSYSICVLHHASKPVSILREMRRVAGKAIIFEHNPYNPLTRLAVWLTKYDRGTCLINPKRLVETFKHLKAKKIHFSHLLLGGQYRVEAQF